MIKNNSLSDRLNEFKHQNDPLSDGGPQIHNSSIVDAITALYSLIIIVFKSVMFGYASKIVFTTGWNFLEVLCIGVTINFLLTFIYNLIHK